MYIHQKTKFCDENQMVVVLSSCKMQVSDKNCYSMLDEETYYKGELVLSENAPDTVTTNTRISFSAS